MDIEIVNESNMRYWSELKAVPKTAKKTIQGGRLRGMTDIRPQWRLQMMTEAFGPIGIGWYYEVVRTWTELFPTITDDISAHAEIKLYIKDGDKWSAPISGVGGSMLIEMEKVKDYEKKAYKDAFFKPFHSDEAYKMAITDALSVAMKQLGVAADVYMGLADSKYDKAEEPEPTTAASTKATPAADLEPLKGEMTALVSLLLDNGAITQAEYDKKVSWIGSSSDRATMTKILDKLKKDAEAVMAKEGK